jgi:hypothetical protein
VCAGIALLLYPLLTAEHCSAAAINRYNFTIFGLTFALSNANYLEQFIIVF